MHIFNDMIVKGIVIYRPNGGFIYSNTEIPFRESEREESVGLSTTMDDSFQVRYSS